MARAGEYVIEGKTFLEKGFKDERGNGGSQRESFERVGDKKWSTRRGFPLSGGRFLVRDGRRSPSGELWYHTRPDYMVARLVGDAYLAQQTIKGSNAELVGKATPEELDEAAGEYHGKALELQILYQLPAFPGFEEFDRLKDEILQELNKGDN